MLAGVGKRLVVVGKDLLKSCGYWQVLENVGEQEEVKSEPCIRSNQRWYRLLA